MRSTALGSLLLSFAAGCFPTRTSELACATSEDCTDGNSCYLGYCLPIDAGGGTMVDGPPDEPEPDAAADCSSEWGTPPTVGDPCRFAKSGPVTISGTQTLDTASGLLGGADGELVSVGGIQARMYIVDSFTVNAGATLRATGPYPVLIVAWGDISIAGTIDVSSKAAAAPVVGAGANATTCPVIPDGGANNNGGGAGGGGAGFGTPGGNGGQGGSDGGRQTGVAGGAAASPLLQGGCRGGRGGRGGDDPNAEGGAGGGAVYLVSKTRITVTGTIDAGGAGGRGATQVGGGGGGGSGGMIGLEAPQVTTSGTLAANGAGGGQGVDGNTGGTGQDGKLTATAATGAGTGTCGPGGAGGFGGTAAANAANGNCSSNGGGGGGGAYGIIVVKSPAKTLGGTVTPTAR